MIIFANPFLGKTTSIRELDLQAFEINNNKISKSFINDPGVLESIKENLLSAEKDNLLMSMYFDMPHMELFINELKRLGRPLPIIIGCPIDYLPTIKNSINERAILYKDDSKYKKNTYWDRYKVLKWHYKHFKSLQILYPELRTYELKNGQYVTDILRDNCPEIVQAFQGTPQSRISKKEELKRDYPYIF